MDAAGRPGDFAEDAAEVFDFLNEFLEDQEEGQDYPLEHYLKRFPRCESAVRGEYDSLTKRGSPALADSAPESSRVGPYELISEIGRGGQGVVYLAEDTRIARRVALKVLPPAALFLSEDRRRRLRREAEVISRLAHPGICGIFDAQIDSELAYIAMPLVEGNTLGSAIQSQREGLEQGAVSASSLPLAPKSDAQTMRLLAFFEAAARALHSAHEAGVVHRDIKPANLMVTPDGNPVWLDFGQARDAESQLADLTMSGEIFGTPAYMAPEQVGGHVVDARTDVWALAVSLFEALCLRRPFEKSSVHALLLSIQRDEAQSLRELNSHVGEELAVVVETGLERDMQRRYASALAFAEDLARIQNHEPIHARPAGRVLRLQRWVQRHPVLAVALLGMSASLIVVSGLLRETQQANLQKDVALDSALQANEEKDEALEFALGRHLAERAEALLGEDPASALILAIEAVEKAPNSLTREALFGALQGCWLRTVYEAGHARSFLEVKLVPGGEFVAGVRYDGQVLLLERLSGEQVESWTAHEPSASRKEAELHLAVSAQGAWIASGGARGRVCLRELGSDNEPFYFNGPGGTIKQLLFGERAQSLLVRCEGGACVLYEVPTGVAMAIFVTNSELNYDRTSGCFVEQASVISGGSSLRRWDASSGLLVSEEGIPAAAQWTGWTGQAWAYLAEGSLRIMGEARSALEVMLPDTNVLSGQTSDSGTKFLFAAGDPDDARWLYVDLDSRRVAPVSLPSTGTPIAVEFSHDGERLAVLDGAGALWLLDTRDWSVKAEGRGYFRPDFVVWSAGDQFLLTSQRIGPQAQLWYGTQRPDVYTLDCGTSPVRQVQFAPDGERALTVTEEGSLKLWSTPSSSGQEASPGECLATLASAGGGVTGAEFDSTGKHLLAFGKEGVELWNMSPLGLSLAREMEHPVTWAQLDVSAPAWLALDSHGAAWLDSPTSASAKRVDSGEDPVLFLRFVEAGAGILSAHASGWVRLRERDSGEQRWATQLPAEAGTSPEFLAIALDPGGTKVALGRSDRSVHFIDLANGEPAREALTVFAPQTLDWSADGRRLLVTGQEGRGALRVEDLEPLDPRDNVMRTEDFHGSDLTHAAFSSDGTLALTASLDGTVMVRDVRGLDDPRSTILLARLRGAGGAVLCAGFSPGAKAVRVIAGLVDGGAQVWPVDPLPPAIARRPRAELAEWERAREERFAKPLRYR
ncbi:MAG: serine/threonine protein kinase/WD40 repeat protein [Candidatus Paceibacteria bacterium]